MKPFFFGVESGRIARNQWWYRSWWTVEQFHLVISGLGGMKEDRRQRDPQGLSWLPTFQVRTIQHFLAPISNQSLKVHRYQNSNNRSKLVLWPIYWPISYLKAGLCNAFSFLCSRELNICENRSRKCPISILNWFPLAAAVDRFTFVETLVIGSILDDFALDINDLVVGRVLI